MKVGGLIGSLVYTLLSWGLFPIPHLSLHHLLSPTNLGLGFRGSGFRVEGLGF